MEVNFETTATKIQQIAVSYGVRLAAALTILVLGLWLSRHISRLVEKAMITAKVDVTLAIFTRNVINIVLMVFIVLAVLSQLGIQTASFIAVLGAAGLAIGLALQGTLSNLASGVLIILFRPYKMGEVIKVAGFEGEVKEIQVFSTILHTAEGKKVIIPNAKVANDVVVNSSL